MNTSYIKLNILTTISKFSQQNESLPNFVNRFRTKQLHKAIDLGLACAICKRLSYRPLICPQGHCKCFDCATVHFLALENSSIYDEWTKLQGPRDDRDFLCHDCVKLHRNNAPVQAIVSWRHLLEVKKDEAFITSRGAFEFECKACTHLIQYDSISSHCRYNGMCRNDFNRALMVAGYGFMRNIASQFGHDLVYQQTTLFA